VKQKNIKILYQVDITQLKAAEATITKAKTATDQLNKSTKQLGDQSKQTGQQYKLNINDLRGELAALQAQIQRTALTDKARLNELIPKYKELKAQVDQFNKSLGGVGGTTNSVGVSFGNLMTVVKAAIVVGLIKETANAVIQMTALSGKVDGVRHAFNKLPNATLVLRELQKATHGALTDLELMQKALQAKNFGIPLEQLGKLLEFAAIKSQQTGISIQYLTDSIVTGLGRESIKILDNLQIDIGKLKARMQETGLSMREVVGDIVNEELKKMGGYLETGETHVNSLKRAWKAFIEDSAKLMESSGFVKTLTDAVENASIMAEAIRRGGGLAGGALAFDAVKRERESLKKAADNVLLFREENRKVLADRKENIAFIEEEIKQLDRLAAVEKLHVMIKKEEIKEMQTGGKKFQQDNIDTKNQEIQLLDTNLKQINEQIKLLKELGMTTSLENEKTETEFLTIEKLEKRIEDLTEQKKKLNVEDRAGIKEINFQIQAVQRLIDKLNELGMDRKSSASEIRKAFEDNPVLAELAGNIDKDVDQSLNKQLELINKRIKGELKLYSDKEKEREKQRKKEEKAEERHLKMITDMALQSAHLILSEWNAAASKREETTVSSLEKQLDAFNDYSDRELKTAGDNERRKVEMEVKTADERKQLEAKIETEKIAADQKAAEREKKERLRQIAIDTAAGIIRALTVSPGWPAGGVYAGFLAVQGIAQAAIVKKYKDGVIDLQGPGTETSDSIPAMLSKRESVMTAAETKGSMGILRDIRANRLNDKIFDKMVVSNPATDIGPIVNRLDSVVKAVERNKPSDSIRQGFFAYEVKEVQKGIRKKIRKAYFG
jgi:hypothetical protein